MQYVALTGAPGSNFPVFFSSVAGIISVAPTILRLERETLATINGDYAQRLRTAPDTASGSGVSNVVSGVQHKEAYARHGGGSLMG